MVRGISVFLIAAVLSFCSLACARQPEAAAGVDVGDKVTDFTLKDLKGSTVSLSSFSGKRALLLVFTTTWCPHCVTIIPTLKEMHKNYNKNLELIAVYVNEREQAIKSFVDKHNIPYTILVDANGAVASRYKVRGVPTVIVADKNGTIKYTGHSVPAQVIDEVTRR